MPYAPTSVLATLIEDMEADIRLQGARTLDNLSSKGRVTTSDTVDLNWNVVLSDSATATAAMTVAGVDQNTGDTVRASLSMGTYKIYHQFSISRVDLKDASRRGTQALRKLFAFHVKSAILSIRKQVNNYIWNADGSAGFGGFVGMPVILNNTLSYAGIDPTVRTNWISIKDTNATNRNLTRTLLYNLDTTRDTEEVMYDTIVCHPITLQKYTELFDTVQGVNAIPNATNRTTVDLAPGARYYMGIPIIPDRFCPVGQIVFFESSAIELLSFDLSDADQGQLSSFGLKDNFGTISSADVGGMRINVALLPQTNPGTLTFQLFVIPQMKVENRRMVQAIDRLN